MLKIRKFKNEDSLAWDQYAHNSINSTFYHQIGWKKVIEDVYGHKSYYLLAEEDDIIKGILPLFIIGKKIVSLPFAPYGGVCGDNETIEKLLINKAKSITDEEDMNYLEIRDLLKEYDLVVEDNKYFTFHIPLQKDESEVWNKTAKGERKATKKAIDHGITVFMGKNYLPHFYDLYSRRSRELGSPVHSYSFFAKLIEEFPDNTTIQICMYKEKCIGTKFLFFYKNTIISGWAAIDTKYRSYGPNNILTWEIIKYGCRNDYLIFDFGRSEKDSGTYEFKRKWGGALVRNIKYQFYLRNSSNIPDTGKTNRKRVFFSKCWKRMPLRLTVFIGPALRKHFP